MKQMKKNKNYLFKQNHNFVVINNNEVKIY